MVISALGYRILISLSIYGLSDTVSAKHFCNCGSKLKSIINTSTYESDCGNIGRRLNLVKLSWQEQWRVMNNKNYFHYDRTHIMLSQNNYFYFPGDFAI